MRLYSQFKIVYGKFSSRFDQVLYCSLFYALVQTYIALHLPAQGLKWSKTHRSVRDVLELKKLKLSCLVYQLV